jgi:hypothetical protein
MLVLIRQSACIALTVFFVQSDNESGEVIHLFVEFFNRFLILLQERAQLLDVLLVVACHGSFHHH